MSTQEAEETGTETEETTPLILPVTDIEDLFADEEEIEEVEIEEGLSEDELRSRLAKAEKKAAFERSQRLSVARKSWITEAKEHFPYSKPEAIKADSRRAFLEAAKEQDADFRERAEPFLTKAEKDREELKKELEAEMEEKYAKAYGKPTIGSTTAGGESADQAQVDERLEGARKKRDMVGAARALMDGKRI